ncbi:TorF family putative porin [Novosphingobium sp. 9]|uniref:TorF family putative porin n=1 Tax=Novosphingobium sp. 9 TaxID=2025349 RepID=UPI0021B67917|nr:TorF family putative porin [Novosphingobium sp. 9]
MKTIATLAVLIAGIAPLSAAYAQDSQPQEQATPDITVSGSVALTSDYRFRGVSQSDKDMAVQGGLTISHKSGVYVGTWASNLSGWGTFGGANMELDLIGGYKTKLSEHTALDVGLTWYVYPGGADNSDFAEPYVKLSGNAGRASLTAGVAYAPRQYALANVSNAPNSRGQKQDNLYVWGDGAFAIAGTPLTAKAHLGHSSGNPGLGPNGTSVTPTGNYWDWSLGMDATWHNLTLNVSYVDTSISHADAALLQPNFSKGQDGTGSIADGAVVASLTAAF